MNDWQLIKTALRNGTVLILTDGKRVGPGSYLHHDRWTGYTAMLTMASPAQIVGIDETPFQESSIPCDWQDTPTHWMSLPKPPRKIASENDEGG